MTDPNASPVAPAGDTPPPARHGAPFGDRGCFHDGCAPTEAREEGGTHWCTMAPVARCAR